MGLEWSLKWRFASNHIKNGYDSYRPFAAIKINSAAKDVFLLLESQGFVFSRLTSNSGGS